MPPTVRSGRRRKYMHKEDIQQVDTSEIVSGAGTMPGLDLYKLNLGLQEQNCHKTDETLYTITL